jgi:hypothetical protein
VENVELLKEGQCLPQVASFLECYLDHPDSRTRHCAASALVTLSKRCSIDDWRQLDFSSARRIHARCKDAARAGDTDAAQLRLLLEAALQKGIDTDLGDDGGRCRAADGRGEVRLQPLCGQVTAETCAAILKSLVNIGGVVSATFEAGQLVVGTRTCSASVDPAFVADLCTTIQEEMGSSLEIAVLTAVRDINSESRDNNTLGDRGLSYQPAYLDDNSDCAEDEPAYLDDDSDPEGAEAYSFAEFGQWSFLRHASFNSWQLQEHEDDPTIVARLRRARQRLDKRQNEDRSRISRLLSVITPSRSLASEPWHAERRATLHR